MRIYNSALNKYHKEIPTSEIVESFISETGVGFKNDIMNGLPDEFQDCDVLYSEPFWKNGHDLLFNKEILSYDFDSLHEKINSIVNSTNQPVVLVLGKSMLRNYSNYSILGDVILHNYNSLVIGWRCTLSVPKMNENGHLFNNYDLMDLLAKKFECLGDFMCGFGNLAVAAKNNNKKFVCSDIDPKCITVLKQRML